VWDLQQDDYLNRLKAQVFEAFQDHGPLLQSYYIVLCVPPTKVFLQKVRTVKSEFRMADRLLVIDPKNSLAFLKHGTGRVDVTVENILREDDPLRDAARKTIVDLPPTQAAIALLMAAQYMALDERERSLEDLERNAFLSRVYEASPDWPRYWFFEDNGKDGQDDEEESDEQPEDRLRSMREQFAEDIDSLLETFIEFRGDSKVQAIPEAVMPLLALQYDAHVRLGIRRDDVAEYIFHLLGIPERFKLALDLDIEVSGA
jgi:hypothetical protein